MIQSNLKLYIFLSLPFLLWGAFGRFGFEDADTGFILGMGWRMANGEFPYIDFSYVRPFMSLIHAVLIIEVFPDYAQLLTIKIIPLLQLFLSVWLTVQALEKKYISKIACISKYDIAIPGYLIASASLSYYMLWHTIDGIFYQSIGLYFISKFDYFRKDRFLFFASLFLFLGVLSKQNFLATFILSFLFVGFIYGWKVLLKYILFGVVVQVIFYGGLYLSGYLWLYLDSVSSKTKLLDIFNSSIYPYIKSASSQEAGILFGISIFLFLLERKRGIKKFYISFYIIPVIMLFSFVQDLILNDSINFRSTKLDLIIPFYLMIYVIYKTVTKNQTKKNALILLFLSLSWATSVSWGANSPLLYFTPLLVACLYFYHVSSGMYTKQLVFAIQLSAVIFMLHMLSPYRDAYIWKLNYDMGDIYSKASFIKTDFGTYEKHKEYVGLLNKYDVEKLTVLPSMPLSHYLVNSNNPYFIDWAMDTESTLNPDMMIKKLNENVEYVFVETRSIGNPIGEPGEKFYSTVSDYVVNQYNPVERGQYFDVYKIR
ncbi:hypothetical protein [Vibrio parahaemolyticus]|uniref:hypothetical protein n=1 Tax=Vibrio parahaemolyticus TaxID=670 RepID=UPI0011CC725C|nr:hypothetical protein [Vibrio parahaemolyticus]TXM34944.1 hypothetical protein FVP00_14720 [Vibrio parahaemolyticus]